MLILHSLFRVVASGSGDAIKENAAIMTYLGAPNINTSTIFKDKSSFVTNNIVENKKITKPCVQIGND